MMMFASGITSDEVGLLAGAATGHRSMSRLSLQKCLIVSGNEGLRHRLGAVAELSGWSEFEIPEAGVDLEAAVESDYELVIVDVARPLGDRVNDSVELVEEFAGRPNTLLVICGSDGSVDEELWARQIGAWVYLPGVTSGDALVSLFTDARRLAERRGDLRCADWMKRGV